MRRFIRAVAEVVQATMDILTFRKPSQAKMRR